MGLPARPQIALLALMLLAAAAAAQRIGSTNGFDATAGGIAEPGGLSEAPPAAATAAASPLPPPTQQQQPPAPLPQPSPLAGSSGSTAANTSSNAGSSSNARSASLSSGKQEPLRSFEPLPYEASATASGQCCSTLQALNFSSNLPVIVVELGNVQQVAGAPPGVQQLQQKGHAMPGKLCTCGDAVDFQNIPLKIKVRGSSSAVQYAKKSFKVDTLDQSFNLTTADDQKIKLLGFPSDSEWVFHGPENDRTLGLRNWLAYWSSRQMGRYASRTRYFELFIILVQGTPLTMDHYRGVYQLQESVSRAKERVDVAKLDFAVDPSGGYILAYENNNFQATTPLVFTKLTNLPIVVDYPGSADAQVLRWLTNWINAFEGKLLQQPVEQLGDVLDVPAAIDYFIITEITKNPDGYRGSIKMHKDRGGPLVMGPPWDYNEAFGMCCGYPIEGYTAGGASNGTSGGSAISPGGWRFNICADRARCQVEPLDGISQWYRKIWEDPVFRTAASARWQQLRGPGGALADDKVIAEIARLKEVLSKGPGLRNWQRWSAALNKPEYGPAYSDWPAMFEAYTSELQQWTLARLRWMDTAFARQADASAGPLAYLTAATPAASPTAAAAQALASPAVAPASG